MAVILDTENTDNYVQAAHVSHKILGVLCIKRDTQIIDTQISMQQRNGGQHNSTSCHNWP